MTCKNKVTQMVPRGYGYKEVTLRCGNTSIHGTALLCDACEAEANIEHPHGWRESPGDICEHGYYVGNAGGPDYMCPWCEAE